MMSLVIGQLVKKLRTLINEQGKDGKLVFDVSIINKWVQEQGETFELSVDRITGKLVIVEKK